MSKFTDIFYESDHKDEKKPVPAVHNAGSFINSQQPVVASRQPMMHEVLDSNAVSTMKDRLTEKIKASKNYTGVGYVEYMQSISAFRVLPDERQQYALAFSGLAPAGLTKNTLLTTANQSLNVIVNEANNFDADYNSKYLANVENKRNSANAKKQQMQQLNQEIAQLESEAESYEASMGGKKDAFAQASNDIKQSIQNDIDKINQYIN